MGSSWHCNTRAQPLEIFRQSLSEGHPSAACTQAAADLWSAMFHPASQNEDTSEPGAEAGQGGPEGPKDAAPYLSLQQRATSAALRWVLALRFVRVGLVVGRSSEHANLFLAAMACGFGAARPLAKTTTTMTMTTHLPFGLVGPLSHRFWARRNVKVVSVSRAQPRR